MCRALICKFNFLLSRYACPVCGLDSRCLWRLKEQFTDCLIDKALMAFLKRAMLFSSVLACAQTPTRISKEHKAWWVFPKITAKTTTNFDSHSFIELIEGDWLFDLKKHIFIRNCYRKLERLTLR